MKPAFPPLSPCTPADVAALSRLRGVSPDAVRMAEDRGLLLFAESREGRSWIVADSSRWIGIARRMDGRGWECLGGAKARMLRGTWASWPIGIREAESFPAIALVEGGPDLLAAFHFAIEQDVAGLVAPVCMASSGISFPVDVLPRFEGKRARVFLDNDPAGAAAFVRWSDQMREAGAAVDGKYLSYKPDLNRNPLMGRLQTSNAYHCQDYRTKFLCCHKRSFAFFHLYSLK